MNQETPITVLFLITKATGGGAQRYVLDLATHLPKDRYTVALAYGQPGSLSDILSSQSISTHHIPALGRDIALVSDVVSFFQILKLLREMRPEVLHLNSSKAAALGALAGRIVGIKTIIFTAHGWPFKEQRGWIATRFIYFLSWFTAALSHHTIVVSKTDENIARHMTLVGKKTSYIPLGRETLAFKSPEESFRAMFGSLTPPPITASTLRLVSIAELTPNKGLVYAINALEHLAHKHIDVRYVIAGSGEQQHALEEHAQEKGVAGQVYFPGTITDAARNLRGFDAFLLPSVKEGMPYVLLEAAQAGIPVVATTIVAPDFEQLSQFTFVPARDDLALADAIERIAKKPRVIPASNPFPLSEMLSRTMALYSH